MASVIEALHLGQGVDLGTNLADAISALVITKKDSQQYLDCIYTFRLRLKDEIADLLSINEQSLNLSLGYSAIWAFLKSYKVTTEVGIGGCCS